MVVPTSASTDGVKTLASHLILIIIRVSTRPVSSRVARKEKGTLTSMGGLSGWAITMISHEEFMTGISTILFVGLENRTNKNDRRISHPGLLSDRYLVAF